MKKFIPLVLLTIMPVFLFSQEKVMPLASIFPREVFKEMDNTGDMYVDDFYIDADGNLYFENQLHNQILVVNKELNRVKTIPLASDKKYRSFRMSSLERSNDLLLSMATASGTDRSSIVFIDLQKQKAKFHTMNSLAGFDTRGDFPLIEKDFMIFIWDSNVFDDWFIEMDFRLVEYSFSEFHIYKHQITSPQEAGKSVQIGNQQFSFEYRYNYPIFKFNGVFYADDLFHPDAGFDGLPLDQTYRYRGKALSWGDQQLVLRELSGELISRSSVDFGEYTEYLGPIYDYCITSAGDVYGMLQFSGNCWILKLAEVLPPLEGEDLERWNQEHYPLVDFSTDYEELVITREDW